MKSVGPSRNFHDLESKITEHLDNSKKKFQSLFLESDYCHVIKYLHPARLEGFLCNQKQLYASAVSGYTWGDGIYVAPLKLPFTTIMYGRAGIVGRIKPDIIFDATSVLGLSLYQEWIRYQWPWYRRLTTTIHADHANRELRNKFRTRFKIDCVFFRPDQECAEFVSPSKDYWFVLTHWVYPSGKRKIGSGYCDCVKDPEWCVVCTEEYEKTDDLQHFKHYLGPALRTKCLTRVEISSNSDKVSKAILANYQAHCRNSNTPILILHF